MPIEIRMPALSPTMTEGNLAQRLQHEGDPVAPGDVIAEIETDKATMEVEAVDEGTLGKIVIGEGTEGVPVNAVIGVLLEEGEDRSARSKATTAAAPGCAEPERARRRRSRRKLRPRSRQRQSRAASRPVRRRGPGGRLGRRQSRQRR